MTRLYIELAGDSNRKGGKISKAIANQEFVMKRAKEIMRPYKITWTQVEWFGIYQIGQRVSSSFADQNRVFICGDAGHTHSPKAAQGMNVSMHDSYNLAWKLAQVLQGIAPPSLLDTYELERRKIACDLIRFDHEHANAFIKNDAKALADNFRTNIRFISGVGAVYGANALNLPSSSAGSRLIPGEILPPAKATRYIDANPIDLQIDIPVLGQYRLYFITPDYHASKYFLDVMAEFIASPQSILGRASAASRAIPLPAPVDGDQYLQPGRYRTTGRVFTPALITATPRHEIELEDLAPLFQEAKWTVYLDTFHSRDHCSPLRGKWWAWGGIRESETRIVVVRPDGYVGAVSGGFCAEEAERGGQWLEHYFGSVLKV